MDELEVAFDPAKLSLDDILALPNVPYRERQSLPATPGIYFILIQAPEWKLIYVGMSFRLSVRLTNHSRYIEIEYLQHLGIPVSVAFIELDPEQHEIDLVEDELISTFQPALNKYIPAEHDKKQLQVEKWNGQRRKKLDFDFHPVDELTKKRVAASITEPLEIMVAKDLRAIAMELRVVNYSRSSVANLIEKIKRSLGSFYKEAALSKSLATQIRRERKPRVKVSGWKKVKKEPVIPTSDEAVRAAQNIDDRIDSMTTRQLKVIGSVLNVSNYCRLTKVTLVAEIKKQKELILEASKQSKSDL